MFSFLLYFKTFLCTEHFIPIGPGDEFVLSQIVLENGSHFNLRFNKITNEAEIYYKLILPEEPGILNKEAKEFVALEEKFDSDFSKEGVYKLYIVNKSDDTALISISTSVEKPFTADETQSKLRDVLNNLKISLNNNLEGVMKVNNQKDTHIKEIKRMNSILRVVGLFGVIYVVILYAKAKYMKKLIGVKK